MKRKFDLIRRVYVGALASSLLWSLWAIAQTNAPASTNAVRSAAGPALGQSKSGTGAKEVYLTFSLDRVEALMKEVEL